MQVTVEIPDELAEQLKAQGRNLEELVRSALKDSAVTVAIGNQEPRLTLEEMFERMAAYSYKIPQLSDYAFTRESFYEDHD